MGRTVEDSNPSMGKRFLSSSKCQDWLWDPPRPLFSTYRSSCPGVKRPLCEVKKLVPLNSFHTHILPRLMEKFCILYTCHWSEATGFDNEFVKSPNTKSTNLKAVPIRSIINTFRSVGFRGRSLKITGKGYIPISRNRKLSLLVCTSGKISSKNPQSNTTAHQIKADNASLFVFTAMLLTSQAYRPVESS